MNILVTGASGMIGSHLVQGLLNEGYNVVGADRVNNQIKHDNYKHIIIELADLDGIIRLLRECEIDRVVHLAALAHAQDGNSFTWDDYKHLNIECAKNVFNAAGERPVLFISTVDVYGFVNDVVTVDSDVHPVSNYAKSKSLAELACQELLPHYTIFRFSPVYTNEVKRDIQKRYYIKYPTIAYQIGRGKEYEVLNIDKAVAEMVKWCSQEPSNNIRIIKDATNMWTPDYIKHEKADGRAKLVLYIPDLIAIISYNALKGITGENKYTYLLSKAINPLKTK